MFAAKALLLATLCVATLGKSVGVDELNLDAHWETFKEIHGKRYSAAEELHRRTIFLENVRKILVHNLEADLKTHSYHLGINEFADLTKEEFDHFYKGLLQPSRKTAPQNLFVAGDETLPDQVDWRKSKLVTPVKNQGQCGSCWAFSAVASLEGQHAKATGQLVSLSEQNLVDCSGKYGNHGCHGGLMDYAFQYIHDNGGIDTEESYPYDAHDDPCHFNSSSVGATLKSYVDVQQSEDDLKAAAATVGPISVAINASHDDFRFYSHGVYNPTECSSTLLDHGVTVVGYGKDADSGLDYWLIKNSWGATWGEEGYVKLVRNKDNRCGVATAASYPVV